MKITALKIHPLKNRMILINLLTDEGISGIGQLIGFSPKSQIKYIEEVLKPIIINKNPLKIEKNWKEMYWKGYGKNGWIQAIAAIDIAMYDIYGKVKKKPLYKILGKKKIKTNHKLYWSMGHGFEKTPKQMLKLVEMGWSLGFRAFKIRMDWHELRQDINPLKDYQMLKLIRKFLPKHVPLGFDANGGYSVNVAIKQGIKFEDLGGISYFEEPVATYDLEGLKKVVDALSLPISFGEYEKTYWRFKEVLKIANPDIIQPDILNVGGFSQLKKVYELARENKKLIFPHSPDIGILSFASLHMYSTINSSVAHEYSPELYKFKTEKLKNLFNEDILPVNGRIKLNDKHGLGLTVNEKFLKRVK